MSSAHCVVSHNATGPSKQQEPAPAAGLCKAVIRLFYITVHTLCIIVRLLTAIVNYTTLHWSGFYRPCVESADTLDCVKQVEQPV